MLNVDQSKIREALDELAKDVKDLILARMSGNVGINRKTGTNTLVGSDLMASVDVVRDGDESLSFSIAEHFEYVVLGWQRTGNFPGTWAGFIRNLEKWIRRKNIPLRGRSVNSTAWAIAKTIMKDAELYGYGIDPRPFIKSGSQNNEDPSKILDFLNSFVEVTMDDIFNILTEPTDQFFKD